jgi:chromosome segregation ATPase
MDQAKAQKVNDLLRAYRAQRDELANANAMLTAELASAQRVIAAQAKRIEELSNKEPELPLDRAAAGAGNGALQ